MFALANPPAGATRARLGPAGLLSVPRLGRPSGLPKAVVMGSSRGARRAQDAFLLCQTAFLTEISLQGSASGGTDDGAFETPSSRTSGGEPANECCARASPELSQTPIRCRERSGG